MKKLTPEEVARLTDDEADKWNAGNPMSTDDGMMEAADYYKTLLDKAEGRIASLEAERNAVRAALVAIRKHPRAENVIIELAEDALATLDATSNKSAHPTEKR